MLFIKDHCAQRKASGKKSCFSGAGSSLKDANAAWTKLSPEQRGEYRKRLDQLKKRNSNREPSATDSSDDDAR